MSILKISDYDFVIEKLVGEFNIWELQFSPYAKFKAKIFEKQESLYVGYSNLMIKNCEGVYEKSYGESNTVEKTLEEILKHYKNQLSYKSRDEWNGEDFKYLDMWDF